MTDYSALFRLMQRIRAAQAANDPVALAALLAELDVVVPPSVAAEVRAALRVQPAPDLPRSHPSR